MRSLCPVEHGTASDGGQCDHRNNDERQISLHRLPAESEKFRRNESVVKCAKQPDSLRRSHEGSSEIKESCAINDEIRMTNEETPSPKDVRHCVILNPFVLRHY